MHISNNVRRWGTPTPVELMAHEKGQLCAGERTQPGRAGVGWGGRNIISSRP